MTTPLKTRVLLADDHELVRSGLRLVLDAEPEHFLALAHLAQSDAGTAEEAEGPGDQRAGVRVEHLPVGRSKENRERGRPRAEAGYERA